MNSGKICIPVCAETADELVRKIRLAQTTADLIEVRFDCLRPDELDAAVAAVGSIDSGPPFVATYRSPEEGGRAIASREERVEFWKKLPRNFQIADVEHDLADEQIDVDTRINSHHDFQGTPDNIEQIYKSISPNGDVVKIAVTANDITDTIAVWQLIKRARVDNKQVIPIAMGEAGKWTRILGLAHGAYLTYGSLEPGSETAPGQLSATDLRDLYRIKQLDTATDIYGLIAGDTSYSLSPLIQNTAIRHAGINSVYLPFQVDNLDDFICRMVKAESREIELNFRGFSVTNPFKQAIVKHLDAVDETASAIGAVNTVKIDNGSYYGFNTDAMGFIDPLKTRCGDVASARVALVGAGGAARACIYALKNESADVTLFARDTNKARAVAEEFGIPLNSLNMENGSPSTDFAGFDIIVNMTPLGTKGELENESIATADQLSGAKLVYDLVYNPTETVLLREARLAGVETIGGIDMLITQGAKQFEIWTGQAAPVDEIRAAVLKRL